MTARRRDRLAAATVVVLAVVAAGSAAVHEVLGNHQASHSPGAGPAASVTRNAAAAWVAKQISRAALVSCDPVMCSALQSHGFPVSDLMALNSGGATLMHSGVVVATSVIRSEVGSSLDSVYAPTVIARFGAGSGQIDVRAVAPNGAANYEALLKADQQQRQESGSELLKNDRFVVAARARLQLTAGQVDSRLLVTMAALAANNPVDVLAFGDPGPGAMLSVSPLRSMELTQAPGGQHVSGAAFIRSTLAFLRVQHAPFYPSGVEEIRLAGGGLALRVRFSAPSPLGLLIPSAAGPPGG
jgi:hypothetical protein